MTVYLDCNATTPVDPCVFDAVVHYMVEEYGNAGSRSHELGARAHEAVERARSQVASVVGARPVDVIFTSGATESDNLAILGLAAFGERTGRRHVVSTAIEHEAVLGPLRALEERGFEVTRIAPTPSGWVDSDAVLDAVGPDTLLVSVMHANNETGVLQPLGAIADGLLTSAAYLHTDAAQSFGKEIAPLRHPRIDLISVSGHKLFAPKGVGALIARRRGHVAPPLMPLMFGGGQERGLRPGTLAVHLIVGLGAAAAAAVNDAAPRARACREFRTRALDALAPLGVVVHGDPTSTLAHVLNLSVEGIDADALMLAWKGILAVSKGSACASHGPADSHVLRAMGLSREAMNGAVRLSWSHATPDPDWDMVIAAAGKLR